MTDIDRFKKHNKQPTNSTDPKTKDVDFEFQVPSDELTFNKEIHQAILDSVIDPVIKHQNYLNQQNTKRKPYDIFMAIVQVIGAISALIAAIIAIYSLL